MVPSGDLLVGVVTASNITNYAITVPIGWTTLGTTATWCYSGTTASTTASTTGSWVTIVHNDSAREAHIDPTRADYRPGYLADDRRFETDEQRAAREEGRRIARERWDREQAQRRERQRLALARERAANVRARALLLRILDDAQRTEFETQQTITVVGSAGHRFRLHTGFYEGNVAWLAADGTERGTMCAHPPRWLDGDEMLPLFDIIAGQVLALRVDEPAFVRIANPYSGEMPTYPPRTLAVPDVADESEAA